MSNYSLGPRRLISPEIKSVFHDANTKQMSNVTFTRRISPKQAHEVEALNKANLRHNVTDEKSGFITILYPADLILRLAEVCPPVIASCDGKVVGFLILIPADIALSVRELASVVAPLPHRMLKGRPLRDSRYIRCGPVCVGKGFRGRYIAKGLYEEAARQCGCDLLVTRINESNVASLNAHVSLGFSIFDIEKEGDVTWLYLVRETQQAKL